MRFEGETIATRGLQRTRSPRGTSQVDSHQEGHLKWTVTKRGISSGQSPREGSQVDSHQEGHLKWTVTKRGISSGQSPRGTSQVDSHQEGHLKGKHSPAKRERRTFHSKSATSGLNKASPSPGTDPGTQPEGLGWHRTAVSERDSGDIVQPFLRGTRVASYSRF